VIIRLECIGGRRELITAAVLLGGRVPFLLGRDAVFVHGGLIASPERPAMAGSILV
jgi:hypothetical protein